MRQIWSSQIISWQSIWFSRRKIIFTQTNDLIFPLFNLFQFGLIKRDSLILVSQEQMFFFCIFVELIFKCVCFVSGFRLRVRSVVNTCITDFHADYENILLRKHSNDGEQRKKNHTNSYYCKSWQRRWASIDNSFH